MIEWIGIEGEITPKNIRIRKRFLNEHDRKSEMHRRNREKAEAERPSQEEA